MTYPIGTPGQPWGAEEKSIWLAAQQIKRSYEDEVRAKIEALANRYDIVQYGALSIDEQRYPLFAIHSKNWDQNKPNVLVTGGVHGYETSGVQGAIRFAETRMADYLADYNFVVIGCVSPWGYETINRWNPNADDPNRNFFEDNKGNTISVEESGLLRTYLESLEVDFLAHFDLHETTDTDNSEFRPALSARDAIEQHSWNIPDGFYGVGDTLRPEPDFQKAIIDAVGKVTHIAPADDNGELIGSKMEQFGVINYPCKKLGLCAGLTDARFVTTTEVYPDSPKVDDENCILAQVAAITGGLDYVRKSADE